MREKQEGECARGGCRRPARPGRKSCAECAASRAAADKRQWEKIKAARPPATDAATRFWARVEKTDTCWLWRGVVNARWGYGYATFGGKLQRAHRVAYELLVGTIPPGLVLDHLCRVRHCVNPAHLEAVTQQVNCQRGMTGKAPGTTGERNKAKTHCPRGHELSGDNVRWVKTHRTCRTCERVLGRVRDSRRRGRHV